MRKLKLTFYIPLPSSIYGTVVLASFFNFLSLYKIISVAKKNIIPTIEEQKKIGSNTTRTLAKITESKRRTPMRIIDMDITIMVRETIEIIKRVLAFLFVVLPLKYRFKGRVAIIDKYSDYDQIEHP